MITARADRNEHLPSRQVLAEIPARVVTFLRAIGTHAGVRSAIARGGFTAADHREGWLLLEAVCDYREEGPDPAADEPARDAIIEIMAWVTAHFPRLRAAITRLHPDALSLFTGIETPESDTAVLALATLLQRLDTLPEGSEALQTLTHRRIDRSTRAHLWELVHTAQAAPSAESNAPIRASRQEEILALHCWYTDWVATARAVVKRKELLVALGIASRRRSEREAAKDSAHPALSFFTASLREDP